MAVLDAERLGAMNELMARLGQGGGGWDAPAAPLFGEVHRQVVEGAGIGEEDNVVLLGARDLRPLEWIAPRCRELKVLDMLSEGRLAAMESEQVARGLRNVQFRRWRSGSIPVAQGTMDRILSLGFLHRCRDTRAALRELVWCSHHGCTVHLCEPSSSLDSRTARKYSREAELTMENHSALVAYARSATSLRRFSREGLASLLGSSGMTNVEVTELLHGLFLGVTAQVEF